MREEDRVKIRDTVTFEMQIRALRNVTGMFLNADISNLEALGSLDAVPLHRKCTCYWVTFTDEHGVERSTEKKSWLVDF